ncbi:MAG: PD-(D/E)XK nuclease family protein [Candidatus Omnitrophica bacterium]|nr:PD-(D/E)XK nuclease family protein [Candidatus Omnitrophota bacterium]
MTDFPVQHLSPSSLNMFARCGRQFMYRYLEGLIIPPGISAVRGTGAHQGVEVNLRSIMENGAPAPLEQVDEACLERINTEWERGVRLLPDEQDQPESKLRGDAVDEAIRLSRTHYSNIAPELKPVHVERWFEINVPDLPCTIKGRIDLQEQSGIRELKTGRAYPSEDAAERSPQLTWYAIAAQALDGQMPDYVALDHLVLTKTGVTVRQQSASRSGGDFHREINRAQLVAHTIASDIYPPAQHDHWCCTPKWCGYWNRCPFGAKQSTTVSYAVTGHLATKNGEEDGINE